MLFSLLLVLGGALMGIGLGVKTKSDRWFVAGIIVLMIAMIFTTPPPKREKFGELQRMGRQI